MPGIQKARFVSSAVLVLVLWAAWAGTALAADTRTTAFINASLIPMTSQVVLPGQTVVVRGGRITDLGPSGKSRIPPGARIIDCHGRYLMPGLADMHMHLRPHWLSRAWPVSPFKLYLANGVTTIRCFGPRGGSGEYALAWQRDIQKGRLIGPQLITCGPQLRGFFNKKPEDIVAQQKRQGFDFIKVYSFVSKPEFEAILKAAKQHGIYTAGHLPFQLSLAGELAAAWGLVDAP